jgi:hypothetical protein
MTGKSHRTLPGLVLALVVVAAAGCASLGVGVTAAGDIRRSPGSFEGKEVTVKGIVREVTKLPLVDVKTYELADSSGEIKVTTRGAPPAKGEKLIVRGVVSSTAIVGGHSFGVHLSERERSSAF